jgi:SAM-dependent methyltransferase
MHDVNNIKMLEIGCGASREISERFCVDRNIEYVGVDESLPFHGIKNMPLHNIQQKVIMKFCKALNIRKMQKINSHQRFIRDTFPTKHVNGCFFDVIYGNSTIEHWHEKNEDIESSLSNYKSDIELCYNLLGDGGKLLMSCPIYVHGNHIFMHGHTDMIVEMFSENWSSVTFEVWRKSHGDLLPYCPDDRRMYFKEAFDIDLKNIYLINVTAIK